MAILERHVHTISNQQAYWERERQFKAAEDRLGGFPPKTYYYLVSGSDPTGTMAQERQWDSYAVMEQAYDKLFLEPGIQSLGASGPEIGNTERTEFYIIVPDHEAP